MIYLEALNNEVNGIVVDQLQTIWSTSFSYMHHPLKKLIANCYFILLSIYYSIKLIDFSMVLLASVIVTKMIYSDIT